MPAVVKTLITERVAIKVGQQDAQVFFLPKDAADNLLLFIQNCKPQKIAINELIKLEDINPLLKDSAQRVASILRGARHKEGLSQVELAQKLNITQSDLSKMEHAKRPIGKKIALRLAEILNLDYRIFL